MSRRKSVVSIATLVMIWCVRGALCEEAPGPAPIAEGFAAYKSGGATAAIKGWLKGGPLEGSKDALSQANTLRQVEDYYGSYQGYRVVKNVQFTPTCQMTYVEIEFAKGPAFAKFLTFKSDSGWHVMTYQFNTNVDVVWPESIYLRSQ